MKAFNYIISVLLAIIAVHIRDYFFGTVGEEIMAIAPIIAAGVALGGSAVSARNNKKNIEAEAERRESDLIEIENDLRPLSSFSQNLFDAQKNPYLRTTEGAGYLNKINRNQRNSVNRLSDMSSLGNATGAAKIAGLSKIWDNTTRAKGSLSGNADNYRGNVENVRYRGLSDYIGQKWNAANRANAISANNMQNLYSQNAANTKAAFDLSSTLASY